MEIKDLIFGIILGAVLGFSAVVFAADDAIEKHANRALSCMSAGNTVEQCQDILGISNQK